MIRCVLFDAVGTLIYPDPPVAEVYHAAAREFGSRLTVHDLGPRFRTALQSEQTGNPADPAALNRPPTSEALERERWQLYHDPAAGGAEAWWRSEAPRWEAFAPLERSRALVALLIGALRRSEGGEAPVENQRRLEFGPLVIDSAMREAWLRGASVELTSAEFDLLWLLAANAGRILSREEIFTALRGIEYDGQDRSIDVRISRIRPKIGDDPMHPRLIKTVRSKGYLFVAEAAAELQ